MASDVAFVPPENLAVCVDLLYTTQKQRLEIQKQVDALKATETALREHLINTLPKSDATGIAGKLARATIVSKTEPVVENWDDFFAWVAKTKAWDCLQKRISNPAIRARWENKKVVKGVSTINIKTVSLNKV